MSWQDRIQDAAIETAAGDRFVFEFQDLSNTRDERATVFSFTGRNGDYVQKRSAGSNIFPITLFFSGENYDEVADAFEVATKDPRPLIFTHPLRKVSYKVQLLSLQRNDALATSANEAAFSLTLHESIDLTSPAAEEDAPIFVDNTKNALQLVSAGVYEAEVEFKLPDEITEIKTGIAAATATAATLLEAYEIGAEALAEIEAIKLALNNLIDTFATNIGQVAFLAQTLIAAPASLLTTVADKVEYYTRLLADYTTSLTDPDNATVMLSAAITGYCQAVLQGDETFYGTKTAVFDTIDRVLDYMADYITILDGFEVSVSGFEQSGEIRTALNNIVSTTAENLNGIAFAAKQERSIALVKKEDPYVLAYRLLGAENIDELDALVENFLLNNEITDSKMFELPKGIILKYNV